MLQHLKQGSRLLVPGFWLLVVGKVREVTSLRQSLRIRYNFASTGRRGREELCQVGGPACEQGHALHRSRRGGVQGLSNMEFGMRNSECEIRKERLRYGECGIRKAHHMMLVKGPFDFGFLVEYINEQSTMGGIF